MAEGLNGAVDVIDEDLTLKGLKRIYDMNKNKHKLSAVR
jgi:hypothetical protein